MEFDTLMSQLSASDNAFTTTATVAGGIVAGVFALGAINYNKYTRTAATVAVVGGGAYLLYKAFTEE